MTLDYLACISDRNDRAQTTHLPRAEKKFRVYAGIRLNRDQVRHKWAPKPWWRRGLNFRRPVALVERVSTKQDIEREVVKSSQVELAIQIVPPKHARRMSVSFKKSILYISQETPSGPMVFNFYPVETGGFHEVPWEAPLRQNFGVNYRWPGYDTAVKSPDLRKSFKWRLSGIESTIDRRWLAKPKLRSITGVFEPAASGEI